MGSKRLVMFALVAVLPRLLAGCAPAPAAGQLYSSAELTELLTDHTLLLETGAYGDDPSLLYLARGGTGWLASTVQPQIPPQPGVVSMVVDWYVTDRSSVCVWATPRIGEIPNFVPMHHQCIQVLTYPVANGWNSANVSRGGESRAGWVALYPFNAIPRSVTNQYLEQVRVLFGGHQPSWSFSRPMLAVD
jgi:hypothetical protein